MHTRAYSLKIRWFFPIFLLSHDLSTGGAGWTMITFNTIYGAKILFQVLIFCNLKFLNCSNEVRWINDQYKSCISWWYLQLCSWWPFHLKLFTTSYSQMAHHSHCYKEQCERFINLWTLYSRTLLKWFEIFTTSLYTHSMPTCQFLGFLDHFTILLLFPTDPKKIQVLVIPNETLHFSSFFQDVGSNRTCLLIYIFV
jgi:hypothetical protein